MGCKVSKDDVPYNEIPYSWYFTIVQGQILVDSYPILCGISLLEARIHDIIYNRLDQLNKYCLGTLSRVIAGIGKFRTGKGVVDDPVTLRINDYYEKQRQLCIEVVEDVINTFYHWSPDPFLVYDDAIDMVVAEYNQQFHDNRRKHTNGFNYSIKWINGKYDVKQNILSTLDRLFSSIFPRNYEIVLVSHQYKPLPTWSYRPNKDKLVRHPMNRQLHGGKCASRVSVRRSATPR